MNESSRTVVIIGGVAGGMSAATRMRRLDEDADIIVLERSGFVSYANCGLPYYLGGVIADRDDLLLQTPESLDARFRLDVRVSSEVLRIDAPARQLEVKGPDGQCYRLGYDTLILSPGAAPVVPPIPGIDRAFTLRTVEDVSRISSAVAARPQSAVVIGGGFIGVESAENLIHRGIPTTLVEAQDQVLAPLDPEMAASVHRELRQHGVDLRLGAGVAEIGASAVTLTDGTVLPADLVLCAIGVRPDTSLALSAGLRIGPRGGIAVDDIGKTSDPAIYALGDAAEKIDALDGEPTLVPLANIANRQGRTVADDIAGRPVRRVRTIGTAIVKVFGVTVAVTGWNEKRLAQREVPFIALHTHPGSHAGYYPGAERMHLKVLISPTTGEILGAQAVGGTGVDKRIDVIATAMRAGLTAPELADLELAYAPPFGSAKDPVNMLGYIAENVMSGLTPTVQWYQVAERHDSGYELIDVRDPDEFAAGSIPGAVNVPLDQLRDRLDEVRGKKLVVLCQVGQRGHSATVLLREHGIAAENLDGGYATWQAGSEATSERLTSSASR